MTPDEIFNRHKGKSVLLDTNLLLLLLIGSFERQRIGSFKRTDRFTEEDFDILISLISSFKSILTTPHLLTEVNSLANSLSGDLKQSWYSHFAAQTKALTIEVWKPASEIMEQPSFHLFGLADAALHQLAAETLVITEDFPLSGFLRKQGFDVLNFYDLVAISHGY